MDTENLVVLLVGIIGVGVVLIFAVHALYTNSKRYKSKNYVCLICQKPAFEVIYLQTSYDFTVVIPICDIHLKKLDDKAITYKKDLINNLKKEAADGQTSSSN